MLLNAAAAAAKLLQSCPTLCDPIDSSPTGSPVPGILQARTSEWVAISFSNAWKWKVKVKSLQPCPTLCDGIDGSPLGSSVHGIFQEEHWRGRHRLLSNRWITLILFHLRLVFFSCTPASPVVRLRTRDLLKPKGYGDFKLRSWKNCLTYTLDEWGRHDINA